MTGTWIDRDIERDPDFGISLAEEGLVMDATESIINAMKLKGTNRSGLASLLGNSRAFVSQLLNGEQNLTLRTLARVGYVLGFNVKLTMRPMAEERLQYRKTLSTYEPLLPEGVLDYPAPPCPGGTSGGGQDVERVAC